MNTACKPPRPQHGLGLIEVLVAILLLAVGLLGMSKIHGLLIRDGGTANNRALAISLAQQKLDDLRSFKWIDSARSAGENCGPSINCYSEIANNLGGLENSDGTLKLPSGSETVGPTTFNRTWTVTTNTAPDFKVVTVTVTWTDPNGDGTEALTSTIAAEDPNITAFGAAGQAIGGAGPKASYVAQGTPDVVPVQITDAGVSRETSKPLPDVSSKALSVATQFASVNYDSSGQQTQEDFKTVSCRCQYSALADANPAAYYTYASGSLVVKYPSSPSVNKWTGSAITSQGDSQDPLCDACCKDHHDNQARGVTTPTPTTALFDPDRPDTDYHTDGDHKHYYFTNAASPNLGLVEVAQSSGNQYLEACRFLRVDGIYRIMQDWRLSTVTVLPKDNYLQVADKLTAYQTYIQGVVKGQAKADGGTNTGLGTAPTDRDLANLSAGYRQLLARGIYVDRVYSASQPRTEDAAYYNGVINEAIGINSIPFNEVNVTLLASWFSSNTSVATVANDDIRDITAASSDYYGVYNRGRVNVLSGSGNSSNITAYMLPSNSGLTAGATRATYSGTVDYPTGTIAYSSEIGIDPNDHGTAQRKSSTINIARAGGSATRTVSGVISKGNYSGDLTKVAIGATGATCTIDTPTGNTTSFSCLVDGFTGDLALSTSQSGAFFANSPCMVSASSDTCGSLTVYGPSMYVSGSCSGQGQSCSNRNLAIVTSAGTTCTTGSTPQCPVPVTATQRTWTGVITVTDTSNGAKVDIAASGSLSCSTTQGTKTLGVGPVGPADAPSSFVMCVR